MPLDFLTQIITVPANWFLHIIYSSKTAVIFVIGIIIVVTYRYIIFPLTGSNTGTFSKESFNTKENTNHAMTKEEYIEARKLENTEKAERNFTRYWERKKNG